MIARFTPIFHRIVSAVKGGKRILFLRGGTSSSKTWSILQFLLLRAMAGHYVNIVGLSYPHLRLGVIRDCKILAKSMGINWGKQYKATEHILVFPSGGQINFLSVDNIDTAHGVRSGDLYINECNFHSWDIVDQLVSRTSGLVLLDCNPSKKFWIVDRILENPAFTQVVYEDVSTYKDNPFLEPSVVAAIESHDRASNWWRVYGKGEWGQLEGLVFSNVKVLDFDVAQFVGKANYGIDWGFAADAFAFSGNSVKGRDLYIFDEIYMHNALNKDTMPPVKAIVGSKKVICDNARPEAIAEYMNFRINAVACKKGKGSVDGGYQTLQSFDNIFVLPSCRNTVREFSTLEYRKDKRTGEYLAEIAPGQDDHAIDAIRYSIEHITLQKKNIRAMFAKISTAEIHEKINQYNEDTKSNASLGFLI